MPVRGQQDHKGSSLTAQACNTASTLAKWCRRLVPRQCLRRAHPDGFKLLGFIGHRCLALRHSRHQKRHVKALGQIAVGDPARQHVDVAGSQRQTACLALLGKTALPVHRVDVTLAGPAAIGMARQQHAQFFKTLADGSNRFGQCPVCLGGTALANIKAMAVCRVNPTAGKDVSARHKTGCAGAARHQDFKAHRGVAQQQHRGGGSGRGGRTVRVQALGGAGHG